MNMGPIPIKGPECDLHDIARFIAAEIDEHEDHVVRCVKYFFLVLPHALEQHGRVEVDDGGVFKLKQKKPRKERNFQTNEVVQGPARAKVTYKAAKNLADAIEAKTGIPTT